MLPKKLPLSIDAVLVKNDVVDDSWRYLIGHQYLYSHVVRPKTRSMGDSFHVMNDVPPPSEGVLSSCHCLLWADVLSDVGQIVSSVGFTS